MLVLPTQKCHLPRAVSRAAPDKQQHRQPCLLTNKWLPAWSRRNAAKHGWLGCTQAPSASYNLQPPCMVTLTSPPVPPCLPRVSWLQPSPPLCLLLGLPLPQPVLGSCQTLSMSPMALGHSLVTQDDPLDACSKENNRADICQVVKESQGDAESCLWVLGPCHSPVKHLS